MTKTKCVSNAMPFGRSKILVLVGRGCQAAFIPHIKDKKRMALSLTEGLT